MGYICAVFTVVIVTVFLYLEYKRSFISPAGIFYAIQILMLSGLIQKYDFQNYKSDYVLVLLYFTGNLMVFLGNHINVVFVIDKNQRNKQLKELAYNSTRMMIICIILMVVSMVFFARNGNAFIMSIRLFLSGASENIIELRRSITRARGSGFIYIFRIYIIPYIVLYYILYGEKKERILGVTLLPITLLLTVASGQRGGLAYVITMMTISIIMNNHYVNKKRVIQNTTFIFVLLFSILGFTLLTIFNGRVSGGNIRGAVVNRFIFDNQGADLSSFRHVIYGSGVKYGYEWLMNLLNIIPGFSSPGFHGLASETFKAIYGSYRGTAPPSIWGSMYYNWGFVGTVFWSFLLGILFRMVYLQFKKYNINTRSIHYFAFLFFTLGSWFADGPQYLFNGGFLELIAVSWFLSIHATKNDYEIPNYSNSLNRRVSKYVR